MNRNRAFISAVMAMLVFWGPVLSHADDKWLVHDKVYLTSTATVHLYQQGVAKTWHDGGVQGGQALVQVKLTPRYTREEVKLMWQKQKGKCPSDSQITEFQKGWDTFIVWAEKSGRYEEVVTIISSWNHKTRAPGPIIITAIIDAIAGGAKAAIGGVFFERAMAAIRPSTTAVTQNAPVGTTATGGQGGQGGVGLGIGGQGGQGGNAAAATTAISGSTAVVGPGAAGSTTGSGSTISTAGP